MKFINKLLITFLIAVQWHLLSAQKCDVKDRQADQPFPDLTKEIDVSYELSVEFVVAHKKIFSFIKEYYDLTETEGRIDYNSEGKIFDIFYYYYSNETFTVEGEKCKSATIADKQLFEQQGATEWRYERADQPTVFGLYAMLLHGRDAWQKDLDRKTTGYMGPTAKPVRGINAQVWKRCTEKYTFLYYFSADKYTDATNGLIKRLPIRIEVTENNAGVGSDSLYPQLYDIMTIQPYLSNSRLLEIPAGIGCKRSDDADIPYKKDYEDNSFLVFGEAIYKDVTPEGVYDYDSTFMFAMDVDIKHVAFFYTPWDSISKSTKKDPNGFVHQIYDMNNKILYLNDLFNDKCTITRESKFFPKYTLPDAKGGYIALTDWSILFPDNEFQYVTEGVDRNMEVYSFEAIQENYNLGDRTVPKVIITRNYLKDSVEEENSVGIQNAITSIKVQFFDDKGKKEDVLILNFFGFTTNIENEQYLFDVKSCFQNSGDFMWITMGFDADEETIKLIKEDIPSIEMEFRDEIKSESEINPVRMPTVLVEFSEMVYVSFILLDKPNILLDFKKPEPNMVIKTDQKDGPKSVALCATECLESQNGCWGFAMCGAVCYFGTGDKTVGAQADCSYYPRQDNLTFIKSKEVISENLQNLVRAEQIKLVVRVPGQDKPTTLTASYFEANSPGDNNKIFDVVSFETNPRLRVLKVGAKLDPNAGKIVKNFGKLRYDECQRLCLDYDTCETVSFCLKDSSCILSSSYGDDIPKDKIIADNFCNLLTRKYTDQFERTPGLVLSKQSAKSLSIRSVDDCARACIQEKSFNCQSFDNCPASADNPCRLHTVHFMDVNTAAEKETSKETACGHYSRKYTYNYKKEPFKRTLDINVVPITNITLEKCARHCAEYIDGTCYGYDFCEDQTLTNSWCTLLSEQPSKLTTGPSNICNHFTQRSMESPSVYGKSTAAWVGILCFVISAIVGVALTFGIGYWRANRAS